MRNWERGTTKSTKGAKWFFCGLCAFCGQLNRFPLSSFSWREALICVICGFFFRVELAAETLIFPPAALSDLAKLGPERIEVRWKPRSIPDGYFPVVEGYYVVYNHENLSLFFGPVSEEKDAIGTQNELTKIRSDLIRKNPSLTSSTIGRIHIDFGEDPPVSENLPPPGGFKPVRVLSGNSTLELGQVNEGAEPDSPPTEGPASSTYGIAGEADNLDGIPEDGSDNALNETPQGAENNESSPESSGGGSPAEERRNDPGETGILKVISQGAGPPQENPGAEGANSEAQSQSPQSPEGELAGTGNPNASAPSQTESSESGESAGPPGQTREPEIEPLRQGAEHAAESAPETVAENASETATEGAQPAAEVAEPAAEVAEPAAETVPETVAEKAPKPVAQSNAPTPANPEKSESEELQKTKTDTVHINQLLKGTLDRPLPKE